MARLKAFDLLTLGLALGVGTYTGVRFFTPIVIEQLKKDGNLRSDVHIPEFDEQGNSKDIQRELAAIKKAVQENKAAAAKKNEDE